jgi:tRNA pseudouridine55 synthase
MPPMHSAIKVNGQRLYDLARQGQEIERNARKIEIYKIQVVNISRRTGDILVLFDISCSKGTYIRTICFDIGEKLGCGAHMSFLLRTRAGVFSLNDSYSLEELSAASEKMTLEDILQPMELAFQKFDCIYVTRSEGFRLGSGLKIVKANPMPLRSSLVRIQCEGQFLGLADWEETEQKDGKYILHTNKWYFGNPETLRN